MHIQGHILDVLCTSKYLSSGSPLCKGRHIRPPGCLFDHSISGQKFLQSKVLKIRKLSKINKTEFMSDIADSELIQGPYKTASLLSHQYFHTLRNLLDKHASVHERRTPQYANRGLINSNILAANRRKHKVEREWRRDNSAINRSRYRAAVNHFNRLLECAKPNTIAIWSGKMRTTPRPCGIP